MYYVGTVLLGMSEATFWACTPRKLFSLLEVHIKVNGLGDTSSSTSKTPSKDQNKDAIKSLMAW